MRPGNWMKKIRNKSLPSSESYRLYDQLAPAGYGGEKESKKMESGEGILSIRKTGGKKGRVDCQLERASAIATRHCSLVDRRSVHRMSQG